jgi:hypothetical protein
MDPGTVVLLGGLVSAVSICVRELITLLRDRSRQRAAEAYLRSVRETGGRMVLTDLDSGGGVIELAVEAPARKPGSA